MDVRCVIYSRGRSRSVSTQRLFPHATLVVPTDEVDLYAPLGLETIAIPPEIWGCSRVRAWICRRLDDPVLLLLDDDISRCVGLMRPGALALSVEEIDALVRSTAQCAVDVGTGVFGWNLKWDTRHRRENKPFELVSFVGGAVGMVGRTVQWDENILDNDDADLALQCLRWHRIIWRDNRFAFVANRDTMPGGNQRYRSPERKAASDAYLRQKWGRYIEFGEYRAGSGSNRTTFHVQRQQSLPGMLDIAPL